MSKTVVYTAIFGDQVKLYPQPELEGIDYICFSDRPHQAKGWKVVECKPMFDSDPIRNNRYYKLHPHLFLKDYDQSIYIDGNFVILDSPLPMMKKRLKSEHMLVFNHLHTKTDPRDCIYDEHEAIIKLYQEKKILKDDLGAMSRLIDYCHSKGYPKHNGLVKGGVLIRKHLEPEVIHLMERWWYFVKNYSKRDQLSFNFVAWEQEFKFGFLPGDIRRGNPWFLMISKNDRSLKLSLLKYRFRRTLSTITKLCG